MDYSHKQPEDQQKKRERHGKDIFERPDKDVLHEFKPFAVVKFIEMAGPKMRDLTGIRNHHLRYASIYNIWCKMRQRCENPKDRSFKHYGARGIKVCEAWKDFRTFFSDMGHRPSGLTLDRIDNDGNYEPKNCRWATQSQQCLNQRRALSPNFKCGHPKSPENTCVSKRKDRPTPIIKHCRQCKKIRDRKY